MKTDHCIDALRQSVMCHGDVATLYWQWTPGFVEPQAWKPTTHTCRNFDKIEDWAAKNRWQGGELRWVPAQNMSDSTES
jgi:hypothetical protein